jgi:hypothetical protein
MTANDRPFMASVQKFVSAQKPDMVVLTGNPVTDVFGLSR